VRRWPLLVYVALFALAAAFRFLALKSGFVNDHFVYISGGRQMLFGEWPSRDWIDPGLPLMFAASALAQKIFGPTLFAEAMLVSLAFGLAAAFTAAAVRCLTGSMLLAILATLFEIAVFPRTYSYPKIVAYAFEFWLYGRYLARPDRGRLFAMAAGVALAFLFRHDHGLFLGAGAMLTILMARERMAWKASIRDAAMFTAVLLILLLPYLVYVQAYQGLWVYFRTGVEFSQREAARQWHVWPRVFGDERPLESALLYELYLVPLIAIGVVLARGSSAGWRTAAARIAPLALVALLVDFSFIRDPLGTRLADAIVPAVVLGAWLLSRAFSAASARLVTVPLALVCVALMGASVLAVGSTYDEIDRAGLLGHRQEIPHRFVERTADLKARFTDYQLPTPSARLMQPFFHYVDRCTSPQDRLLVGGFMVEVPFYAQRLFAAGQEYFGGYFGSAANERFAFDRLRRQSVPFVIVPSDYLDEFNSRFPLVSGYVHARYEPLTDLRVDDDQTIHILVSRDMPSVTRDAETGWPCFRSQAIETRSQATPPRVTESKN
jgi:hypothetical protein